MARIDDFSLGKKDRYKVHEPVNAEVFLFQDDEGNTIVQIDTFGSKSRKEKGKTSQSLQLSEHLLERILRTAQKRSPDST